MSTNIGIKKVSMNIESIISLIESYKGKADWKKHPMSQSWASEAHDCSDMDVKELLDKFEKLESEIKFTISDIEWEEYGNCVGDELYPVVLHAVLLPDGKRYYIAVSNINGTDEYIYSIYSLQEE